MSIMADTILIVEDEQVLRESLGELLQEEGYDVLLAANGQLAYEILLDRPVDLVLSDIRMPEMDGMVLLRHVQRTAPQTPMILITAYGTVSSAVNALQSGAMDYLLKPVQFDDLLAKVRKALEFRKLKNTCRVLTEQLSAEAVFHNLVGQSRQMLQLFDLVRKLSTVKSSVLVVGESGTGKELIARAIHYNGVTRDRPFVPVNCGAIPDTLVESELFGYRRGAFTGANQDKMGFFEAADGGTLFLDEISTLRPNVQSSLLRALEERVIVPVGDTRPRAVDVRIIAASNRNLEDMVKAGEFREDLLYRLNVVNLHIPPLRARKEDIPPLIHHFLEKHTREMNKTITGVTNGAMRAMLNYDWRGNVRELENVIERAVIFADGGELGVENLPFAAGVEEEVGEELKDAIRLSERQHIINSLRRHGYDKNVTAQKLGIGVSSLYRKLDEMNIPKSPDEDGEPEGRRE